MIMTQAVSHIIMISMSSTKTYIMYIKYIKYRTFTTDIGWLDVADEADITYPAVGAVVGVAEVCIDGAALL